MIEIERFAEFVYFLPAGFAETIERVFIVFAHLNFI